MLFSVYFYYQNYFGLIKGAVGLFYTYFIVPKVSVNYRNIKSLKHNSGSVTLNNGISFMYFYMQHVYINVESIQCFDC